MRSDLNADAGDQIKFVDLLGLLPCVPFVYTYLVFLHYKCCGVGRIGKIVATS